MKIDTLRTALYAMQEVRMGRRRLSKRERRAIDLASDDVLRAMLAHATGKTKFEKSWMAKEANDGKS